MYSSPTRLSLYSRALLPCVSSIRKVDEHCDHIDHKSISLQNVYCPCAFSNTRLGQQNDYTDYMDTFFSHVCSLCVSLDKIFVLQSNHIYHKRKFSPHEDSFCDFSAHPRKWMKIHIDYRDTFDLRQFLYVFSYF